MNYTSKTRALAVLAFIIATASASGCAIPQKSGLVQAGGGTIEICETRGTHTQCFKQDAEEFAGEVEAQRERMELVEHERSDDG